MPYFEEKYQEETIWTKLFRYAYGLLPRIISAIIYFIYTVIHFIIDTLRGIKG